MVFDALYPQVLPEPSTRHLGGFRLVVRLEH